MEVAPLPNYVPSLRFAWEPRLGERRPLKNENNYERHFK